MTLDDFQFGMLRLEQMFNRGIEIDHNVRKEYFEALRYVNTRVFQEAVAFVIGSFKPYPSETFPSLAVLESAVIETRDESAEAATREARRRSGDTSRIDYCQRCDNLGLYLRNDGQAHLCQCEKGREKRASWNIPFGIRKRDEKIQKALEKIPPSSGPVRGLHEWNPLGFWEDSQEEHDTWMAVKRVEVAAIKERMAGMPERRAMLDDDLRRKLLKDIVAGLRPRKANLIMTDYKARATGEREPGDDDAPF